MFLSMVFKPVTNQDSMQMSIKALKMLNTSEALLDYNCKWMSSTYFLFEYLQVLKGTVISVV